MKHTDQNFPLLTYQANKTSKDWGRSHGEEFKVGIAELVEIRRELMLTKNPALADSLDELAQIQFKISQSFAPDLADELLGIAEGSGRSLSDIILLNNYTDFRDIELPEEGCSTVHIKNAQTTLAGQTWDMHGSAKNYVNIIRIPPIDELPACLIFSLVGCVGMMGYNSQELAICVNNINTKNAKTGLIWPLLVRKVLQQKSFPGMRDVLTSAPVTSGHNYLISSLEHGEHWEVSPDLCEKVLSLNDNTQGSIYHTNHCLGKETKKHEDAQSLSSTTHQRFSLLKNKLPTTRDYAQFKSLLADHENYPKSICSHFESGAQDPSFTCGGAIGDLTHNKYLFWRGCHLHDLNYKEFNFQLAFNKEAKLAFELRD